jgi:hypothetical protein
VILVAGALAIAVPAAAKPPHAIPPTHPSHPSHPATPDSHKCAAHKEAYIASGKFVSWSATSTDGRHFTGMITVDVTNTNHHAKTQKGTTVTYMLSSTKVTFGKGANPPAAGDRVVLIGKITAVPKKCTNQSAAGTITLRKVDISVPKGKHHT